MQHLIHWSRRWSLQVWPSQFRHCLQKTEEIGESPVFLTLYMAASEIHVGFVARAIGPQALREKKLLCSCRSSNVETNMVLC